MNLSAQLSPAEVEFYSDPDRTYSEATVEVAHIAASLHRNPQETVFESSLRVKNTLDAFERMARKAPSWRVMALLLNCEYKLWCLNAETPLRQNPFLTHWVEAFQRSSKDDVEKVQGADVISSAGDKITTKEIFDVRAELIKRLLLNEDMKLFSDTTPREFHHMFAHRERMKPFDIQFYVQMLEEEGIYEKTPEPQVPARRQEKGQSQSDRTPKQWTRDITEKLKEQPDTAVQELTRLPLELSYLDFLTTMLTDHMLEAHFIDPAPVITSYIQHALRITEQMGEPPGHYQKQRPTCMETLVGLSTVAAYENTVRSRRVVL